MKLLDKIKDLFMDDVTDDDEIEYEEDEKEAEEQPSKTRNVLPKVMRETIKKEEKEEEAVKPHDLVREESDQTHKRFNFPLDVDSEMPSRSTRGKAISDEPVRKTGILSERKTITRTETVPEKSKTESVRNNNVNVLNIERETAKKVSELYSKKSEDKNVKPKFKASPVISPVYGVLDKNYTKEEVKERTDDTSTMKRPSKKVDFETVRKKAFGNLADDIKESMLCENCELYKEVKKISSLKEDDLLYDMTVDEETPKEEKEITIEKAYDDYEEFGVAYEPKVEKKRVSLEETQDLEEVVIKDNNEEEPNSFSTMLSKIDDEEYEIEKEETPKVEIEEEPVKEEKVDIPSRSEKKKETKVDDDFFELIDSMYKERVDE